MSGNRGPSNPLNQRNGELVISGEMDRCPNYRKVGELFGKGLKGPARIEAESTAPCPKVHAATIRKFHGRNSIRNLLGAAWCRGQDGVAKSTKALGICLRERVDIRVNRRSSVSGPSSCHAILLR